MLVVVLCTFIGFMGLTCLAIYLIYGGFRRKISIGSTTEEKILTKLHNLIYHSQKDPNGWDVLQVRNYENKIREKFPRCRVSGTNVFYVCLTSCLSFRIRRDRDEKYVEIRINGNLSYGIKQVEFKTTDVRAHQIMDEILIRYTILREWGNG